MKITEALLAEHLVFHNLFDYLESTVPKLKTLPQIKSLAALLRVMLDAHSRTEDELFIGPLEHCFEQIGQRETFHQDHEDIEESLISAEKARQSRQARRYLLAAVVCCRKHFDKEERIVFPMAERVLNTRTLQALGQTWMRQRTHG
jgi:hemerythrin-like domain-containing protein